MLRQVLLICFDGMIDVVLARLNFSKTDRWRRWLALRRHRERMAEAAVWQADPNCVKDDINEVPLTPSLAHAAAQGGGLKTEDRGPTPSWDKHQRQHQCWGEVIPYVHLFWPFIEHQEVPSNLDMCIVSDVLQQLHALAAKKPQVFKEYPLLSEEERYGGDFAWVGEAFCSKSAEYMEETNELEQPFYTLGSGSPLYD